MWVSGDDVTVLNPAVHHGTEQWHQDMAFGRRILKDSNTIPYIPHQIRTGKDGEEEFWENNDEQDQEVDALCQCFEETSNTGHTETTGKTFRKDVLEVETRVDAMIKSRVTVTQPLGKKAFHDTQDGIVWASLVSLSTLQNTEQWKL